MSNNEISGSSVGTPEALKSLVENHNSLTMVDFSNSESNKFRNKLGFNGLKGLVEGILESNESLIQIINVSGNSLSGPCVPLLASLLTQKP